MTPTPTRRQHGEPIRLAAGTLALCLAFCAAAQKVYRCGPDGRVYQQTPCAEGTEIDASDSRTTEQRQAAQAVAKSEAWTAAQLDRDTMAASAATKSTTRPRAVPAPKDKAASSAASKKADAPSKPLVFLVALPKGAASGARP